MKNGSILTLLAEEEEKEEERRRERQHGFDLDFYFKLVNLVLPVFDNAFKFI